MSLSSCKSEELITRFMKIRDDFDETARDIGPLMDRLWRLEKEMAIIREELERREDA